MCHTSQVMVSETSVAIGAYRLESLRLRRLLHRMRMLEDFCAGGFDAYRVGNGKLVEYCGDRLEQSGSEKPLVLRGQRRNKSDIHTTPNSRSVDGSDRPHQ
jgi:hypothetical protein